MARCKYCSASILWARDADSYGWTPLDPKPSQRGWIRVIDGEGDDDTCMQLGAFDRLEASDNGEPLYRRHKCGQRKTASKAPPSKSQSRQYSIEELRRTYDQGYASGRRAGWVQGANESHEAGYNEALADRAGVSPDLLKRLITLCHPDKHPPERAGECNAVTAQLLELRNNNNSQKEQER